LLLILDASSKISSIEIANEIVSAEIPNPEGQKGLYDSVTQHMIHGPCGCLNPNAPCMKDGICMKGFPKILCEDTIFSENGYPTYRRRPNMHSTTKLDISIGNEWVVPYNPYLTYRYDAHINVEICSGIVAVKYLYKYMYKGFDRATVQIDNQDEIKQFIDGRYLSASEACWHLFAFRRHTHSHAVYRLPVCLPNQQEVQFTDTDDMGTILQTKKDTMLTQFFRLCQQTEFARTLLYCEVPLYFTWNIKLSMWIQ
jgi:hypothetical protein